MDSPRFFRLAPLLMHYEGALRAALMPKVATARQHEPAGVTEVSLDTVLAMTKDDTGRLPGIGYAGS